MPDFHFQPPPVPPSSQALVATLKLRLIEAIETGKATDARTFLDIIDRLARMDWLNDETPQERYSREKAEGETTLQEIDQLIIDLLREQV